MKHKIFLTLGILVLGGALYFTQGYKNLSTSLISLDTIMAKKDTVTLQTNHGDIKIKLFTKEAPKTTENFYTLAEQGKYDDTIFHRVIKGFMIQGGDYENGNGTGGKSIFGDTFEDEIVPEFSHTRGMVSMANRGPNTNGSQFFIVHKDSVFLDGNYSIFGEVVEGMNVVDKISESKTNAMDKPDQDVKIKKATVK